MLLFVWFSLLVCVVFGQPPLFAPLDVTVDGLFEVQRAYFRQLDQVFWCEIVNDGDCLNSLFDNPVGVLFVPFDDFNNPDGVVVNGGRTYAPSFQANDTTAIIVAGFAPALADRISITPFAKFVENEDGELIKAYAPVGVSHSYANDYFVTVLSSNQGMIDAALDWFCNEGGTELTTAICLNYFVQTPFVANDPSYNLDEETTWFSVLFRAETSNANSYELFKTFSQSPALQAWVVRATDSNPIESDPYTSLDDLLAASSGGSSCTYNEGNLPYEDCLPFDNLKRERPVVAVTPELDDCFGVSSAGSVRRRRLGGKGGKGGKGKGKGKGKGGNGEDDGCRYQGYAANEIVFTNEEAFELRTDYNGIFVEGINHLTSGNALYFSVNLVNNQTRNVIARASSADFEVGKGQYAVLFASEDVCEENGDLFQSSAQISFVCVGVALEEDLPYRIEEVSLTSVIDVDLCESKLERPNVYQVEIGDGDSDSSSSGKGKGKGSSSDYGYSSSGKGKGKGSSEDESTTTTAPPPPPPPVDPRPNIVFVSTDDLGFKDVGYNGAEYSTPHIDALAMDGIRLNRYYATPVCSPTRACMFTGRWNFRSNMSFPITSSDGRFLPFNTPLLSEMFQLGGYSTHMVGKWHLGQVWFGNMPERRGFDSYYGLLGGAVNMYDKDQTFAWDSNVAGGDFSVRSLELLNLLFPEQYQVFDFFDGEHLEFEEGYVTRQLTNRALDVIDNHDTNNPLFLFLSFQAPHDPIVLAPNGPTGYPECAGITNQGRFLFCTMVQEMDLGVGAVVSKLQERSMWDNTIFIFASDNGGQAPLPFLDNPGFGVNLPLRGTKGSSFEGSMRVISFVSGGDSNIPSVLRGQENNQFFHAVDWYKTLLALGNIDTSMVPLLDSTDVWDAILSPDFSIPSPRVEFPYVVIPQAPFVSSMTIPPYKLLINADSPIFTAFDGYWSFDGFTPAPGQGSDATFLFDIVNDEIEFVNLANDPMNAAIVGQLQGRLFQILGTGFVPVSIVNTPEGYVINTLTQTALPYLEISRGVNVRFT